MWPSHSPQEGLQAPFSSVPAGTLSTIKGRHICLGSAGLR